MSGQRLTPRAAITPNSHARRRTQSDSDASPSSRMRRRQPLQDHGRHRLAVDRGEAEIEPHQTPEIAAELDRQPRRRGRRICAIRRSWSRHRRRPSAPSARRPCRPARAAAAETRRSGSGYRVGIEAASRRPARPRMRMRLFGGYSDQAESQSVVPARSSPSAACCEWLRALRRDRVTKNLLDRHPDRQLRVHFLDELGIERLALGGIDLGGGVIDESCRRPCHCQPHWLVHGRALGLSRSDTRPWSRRRDRCGTGASRWRDRRRVRHRPASGSRRRRCARSRPGCRSRPVTAG